MDIRYARNDLNFGFAEFKFGHVAPGGATRNMYTERRKKLTARFALLIYRVTGIYIFCFAPGRNGYTSRE